MTALEIYENQNNKETRIIRTKEKLEKRGRAYKHKISDIMMVDKKYEVKMIEET